MADLPHFQHSQVLVSHGGLPLNGGRASSTDCKLTENGSRVHPNESRSSRGRPSKKRRCLTTKGSPPALMKSTANLAIILAGFQGTGPPPWPAHIVVMDLDGGHRSEIHIPEAGMTDMPDWR